MFKVLLDFTYILIPLICAGLLYHSSRQFEDKHSRYFILPFMLFGLKEIFQYYVMQHFQLRSMFFLYAHTSEGGMAMLSSEWMFAMLAVDLFVIVIYSLYVLRYFEYPKRIYIPFLVINIIVVALLVTLRVLGYEVDELFMIRLLEVGNLIAVIILMQKGYFDGGANFVIDSKGYIIAGMIVLIPGLLWKEINSQYCGQIFRIAFYALTSMTVSSLVGSNWEKVQNKISMLKKEKSLIEKLLNSIGSALAANMDQRSILEMINKFSMDATSARAGAILLLNKKKGVLTVEVVEGLYPPVEKVEDFIAQKERFLIEKFKSETIPLGSSYLGKVAQSGKPLFLKDALNDPEIVQSAKGVMDICSIITLPLIADGETLGVLSVINKTTDMIFSDEDFVLANALAEQVAVALNTVKLRNEYQDKLQQEKQVAIAAQIQQGLLPKVFPQFNNLEVYAVSRAAKGVSGDYFDMINFNDKLTVVCADVAGKGVPAAMVMVKIQTAMRLIVNPESEPKRVLAAINRSLHGQVVEDRYATLFYCMYDMHTSMLSYSNAGHGPMLVYRGHTDAFELLDTEGLPVGIAEDSEYGQDETVLNAGDIAILYTDGITEAMNSKRDEYSIQRVKEDIRNMKDLSAKEIAEGLLEKITVFAGDEPQHDDQTLFIFKIK